MKKLLVLLVIFICFTTQGVYADDNDNAEGEYSETESSENQTGDINPEIIVESEGTIINLESEKTDTVNEETIKEIDSVKEGSSNIKDVSELLNDYNTPSANEIFNNASNGKTASERLFLFIEGYELFPNDSRFVTGINESARSLFSWAQTQQKQHNYKTAIDRFETILSAPALFDDLKSLIESELIEAKRDFSYYKASSQATASERLELFIEGYLLYPNDTRFTSGINTSASSLLNWAREQHQRGSYFIAVDRYEYILSAPGLDYSLKREAEIRLDYAKRSNKVPSSSLLIKEAGSKATASERMEAYVDGYYLYSSSADFVSGINSSARSLFTWTRLQHEEGNYEIAVERYRFILSAPGVQSSTRKDTETNLSYAEKGIRTPSMHYSYASKRPTASERLESFVEGYNLFSQDKQFVEGIHSSARSLLNWTKEQHQRENFDTAIERYQYILSAPVVNKAIEEEIVVRLKFAEKGEKTPNANQFYELSRTGSTASQRLEKFLDGYVLYPNDSRFSKGINDSAQSLLNWAREQHQKSDFITALNRYEVILSLPKLNLELKELTTIYLNYAKDSTAIPTANVLIQKANSETTSSARLTLYLEGYTLYPRDIRFTEGIKTNTVSLLRWIKEQHQKGNYDSATNRYKYILSLPVLEKEIRKEVEVRLKYSNSKKKVPTANQLIQLANSETKSIERLELFTNGYILYPNDNRFVTGIEQSARSLLAWAESRHKQKDYQNAIQYYKVIIETPSLPQGFYAFTDYLRELASKRKNINNIGKIVNPKVTNYTYEQMLKDIEAIKKLYPYLVETVVIGRSLDNRDIYAVKLGHGKVEVILNASTHAREHMTTNLLMNMLDEYANAYHKGTKIDGFNVRGILDGTSIWFIPMLNPDGVTLVQKGPNALSNAIAKEAIRINGGSNNFNSWKANARGVDLNRQYPSLWETITNNPGKPSSFNYKGPKPLSEPEAIAMYNFILSKNFKTLVDYHSSGQVLYARFPGEIENLVSKKTGYRLIDITKSTSGGVLGTWFTLTQGKPGLTPEISPYVGPRPVPLANWDAIWRQNYSVGLIVANEAYLNRNKR